MKSLPRVLILANHLWSFFHFYLVSQLLGQVCLFFLFSSQFKLHKFRQGCLHFFSSTLVKNIIVLSNAWRTCHQVLRFKTLLNFFFINGTQISRFVYYFIFNRITRNKKDHSKHNPTLENLYSLKTFSYGKHFTIKHWRFVHEKSLFKRSILSHHITS